jgi:hypothetical protein
MSATKSYQSNTIYDIFLIFSMIFYKFRKERKKS